MEDFYQTPDNHDRLLSTVIGRFPVLLILWLTLTLPSKPNWTVSSSPLFHLFMALCFILYGLAYFGLRKRIYFTAVLLTMNIMEMVVVTALVWATGGLVSPYSILYLLVIVFTTVPGNSVHTLFHAIVAVATYAVFLILDLTNIAVPLMPFTNPVDPGPLLMNPTYVVTLLVMAGSIFTLVFGLDIFLATQLRSKSVVLDEQGGKLQEANRTLLTSFHDMESMVDRLKSNLDSVEKARKELMKTEKMASIGRLAAGTIDELGGPLSTIISEAELLLMARALPTDAKIKDTLKKILANTARIQALMHNLKDSFKASDEQNFEALDLNHLVTKTLSLIAHELEAKGVKAETALDPSEPRIWGIPTQIEQAVLNLLTNSEEAYEKVKGVIKIETRSDENTAFLDIIDNGSGIAKQHIARIFEPFFTTKTAEKHMGLGLYVVAGIMDNHRGHVLMESKPGVKTTFTLVFPRKT